MLRISEIKLPLEHSETALRKAILEKLQILDDELKNLAMLYIPTSFDKLLVSNCLFV